MKTWANVMTRAQMNSWYTHMAGCDVCMADYLLLSLPVRLPAEVEEAAADYEALCREAGD
jgi:hypothetical protein